MMIRKPCSCSALRAAGAQFHHLTQQDQRDDDGGGLEINADIAVLIPEPSGKDLRCDDRDNAEHVRRTYTHRDQAEHVEVHRPERLIAAFKERPPRPKDHGCCKR